LCALYSRSPDSILNHLEVVTKKGPEKFMASYYVGYGHQSIGDNANATLFIENISMLAAKALQDNPLYAGQEVSTRYVDFSKQHFLDPVGTPESAEIQENWRRFYLSALEKTITHVKLLFPVKAVENPKVWEKAVKARAFDILRGFLPAGSVTSIAYHMNLRQIADHMRTLRHNPLHEVRELAEVLEKVVSEGFPSSFGHVRYEKTEEFLETAFVKYYHHDVTCPRTPLLVHDGVDHNALSRFSDVLSQRPPKTELPNFVNVTGSLAFEFQIDFASFRDLQRHRSLYQAMPLLTADLGFEEWYMNALPADVQQEAKELLEKQVKKISALTPDVNLRQYYLPMGLRVSHRLSGVLGKLLYVSELRANKTVHPTLSKIAYAMGKMLEERFSHLGLAVHLVEDYDNFDVKRGTQDIEKREDTL